MPESPSAESVVREFWRPMETVSFFTVSRQRITRLVEYWPEPYSPPQNRRHLTEPIA